MEEIPSNLDSKKTEEISRVEDKIVELLPVNELINIFGSNSFLIGGAVRDIILHKYPSDFDFMSRMSVENIKKNLENMGFTEMEWKEDVKFIEGKYSLKKGAIVFNFILYGKEIQVASIGEKTVSELIMTADSNLSCCAFDLGSLKILDSEFLLEIMNKDFRFMDTELVKNDPMKIVNALKQISRIPDLKISDDTLEIIRESLPNVVKFFTENKHRIHKLKPLFGNINSGQIINLFEGLDTKGIFDGLNVRKTKLKVSDNYHSDTISEMKQETREKISELVASQFGKRFDPKKLFNDKTNSVTYEIDSDRKMKACFLMDGERIYSSSAVSKEKFVQLVADMCYNNYNVWATISISSSLLIGLAQKAGMRVIEDPNLIKKIITNNYPEYKDRLIIETRRGHTVFSKKDSDDDPQVLVIS